MSLPVRGQPLGERGNSKDGRMEKEGFNSLVVENDFRSRRKGVYVSAVKVRGSWKDVFFDSARTQTAPKIAITASIVREP
ncbi:MAG: hypothetical protein ABIY38_09910, partial [Rhodococcus sp. (in: high G+C Gram-positive bacteria)]